MRPQVSVRGLRSEPFVVSLCLFVLRLGLPAPTSLSPRTEKQYIQKNTAVSEDFARRASHPFETDARR